MSKEKTEYRFSVHAAPEVINQVIQNYLAANQYVQIPKPNANYYFFNDPWIFPRWWFCGCVCQRTANVY